MIIVTIVIFRIALHRKHKLINYTHESITYIFVFFFETTTIFCKSHLMSTILKKDREEMKKEMIVTLYPVQSIIKCRYDIYIYNNKNN